MRDRIKNRLVQRLSKPTGYINPWGDMNKQIPSILKFEDIADPDYMGAAEFEWGAYPNFFKHMVDKYLDKKVFKTQFEVKHWLHPDKTVATYLIGFGDELNIIKSIGEYMQRSNPDNPKKHPFGREVSKNDYGSFADTIKDIVSEENKSNKQTIGWINLDGREHPEYLNYGFMWFISEEMYKDFIKLFDSIKESNNVEV